jgi:predicted dinucleotide-binding enzyme
MAPIESTVAPMPVCTPFGKVLGIAENQAMFNAVAAAWTRLGVQQIENWNGPLGIETMDAEKVEAAGRIFGDMELIMAERYLTAVQHGEIVFAAVVEPKNIETAAELAKAIGASELVHFGRLAIRNF